MSFKLLIPNQFLHQRKLITELLRMSAHKPLKIILYYGYSVWILEEVRRHYLLYIFLV